MNPIHISRNRQPLGQFSPQEVADGLKSGQFLPSDLAWREGMDSWVELGTLQGLPPASDQALTSSESSAPLPMHAPGEAVLPTSTQPEPAWERRQEVGTLSAMIESVKQVLTKPDSTFRNMPTEGGHASPLLFNIFLAWIGGAAAIFYQAIWVFVNPEELEEALEGTAAMGIFLAVIVGFLIFYPILIAIAAYFGAAITHVSLLILGGAKKPFETTFRVICYSNGATSILQLVPFCGGFLYPVWYIVATIFGLMRAHQIEGWRAVLAVILPFLLCCGLIFGSIALAGGAAFAALSGTTLVEP